MRLQNEGQRKPREEDSPGGFLAELGFDLVEEFLPDSLIGYIVLILAGLLVLVLRSAMNE